MPEADLVAEYAGRAPARQPATLGETWNAEWNAAGLSTLSGLGQPLNDAYEDLRKGVEAAAGRPIDDLARERNVPLTRARSLDERAALLAPLIAGLPEDDRKRIEPLRDIRSRAADKAAAIEREAGDTANATYGLSGWAVAHAAGIARQAIDPVNLGLTLATAPLGGEGGALLPFVLRQGAVGAGVQAAQEPFIQSGRAALGLEAGWRQAAGDVAGAGLGAAGISGLFRLGAAALRAALPRGDLAPRDMEAAATLAERDHALAAEAPAAPEARAAHDAGVADAAATIDAAKAPEPPPRAPVTGIAAAVADSEAGVPMTMRFSHPESGATLDVSVAQPGKAGVFRAEVPEAARGRGIGTALYEHAIGWAEGEGRQFHSDYYVSGDAMRVYDALGRRGYQVEKNPAAVLKDDGGLTARNAPIYTARRAGPPPEEIAPKAPPASDMTAPPAGEEITPKPKQRRAVDEEKLSLIPFLAHRGGLKDTPDLRAIFDGNPFVPGFGRLFRKTGMDLDRARGAAAEAGYIANESRGGGPLAGGGTSTTNDLLSALAEERRGAKRFRPGNEPAPKRQDSAEREHQVWAHIEQAFHDEGLPPPTGRLRERVIELVDREGVDPMVAYERAIMEEHYAGTEEGGELPRVDEEIPGWDVPHDAEAAPGHGGDAGRADRQPEGQAAGEGTPRPGGGDRAAQYEPGAEGKPQQLIPGVAPVTERDRLQAQAGKPLRGGNKPPPAGGLFDEEARAQLDLLGDPRLAADAERVLAEHGDLAGAAEIREAEEDAAAARELIDCLGGLPEGT